MAMPILNGRCHFLKMAVKTFFILHVLPQPRHCLKRSTLYLLFMSLNRFLRFVLVQSLNCVQLFGTPWTASLQALLSSTICQSLLRFISVELMMLSNYLILCPTLPFGLQYFPASRSFSMSQLFTSGSQSIGASASASKLQVIHVGAILYDKT